jgi:nucleosome binding factor SPN SPT16 subunit
LDLQKYLLEEMKPGLQLGSVYSMAQQFTESRRPDLKGHLPNNLGFGLGLEFRESDYVINSKNTRTLNKGMVFNLALGLQELDNPDAANPKGKIYSLLLADTIEIGDDCAKSLTSELKSLNQVSYSFKSEQEQRDSRKTRVAQVASESSSGRPKLRNQQKLDEASEKKRREHQKELARIRLLEAQELYADVDEESGQKSSNDIQRFESYKKDSLWPKEQKGSRVYVDKRNDTVIFPINGTPVPFHIATIKNVTKNEEGKSIFLRVNFVTPGRSFGRKESITFMDPLGHFLRSLTVRTNDLLHAQELIKDITDLRKQYTAREATKKEMADIVEQEELIEISGRRPIKLGEIYVRPALEGRRLPGDVEIHSNGIRYKMQLKSDQRIDVLFSNIKHLFFQPCDNEMTVIVHLHLKNPIMVGKKKTKDIQIYREALENHVEETGGRRRKTNYGDEDEIAQEKEERRKRQQANDEFQSFAEKISESFKGLEVEIPFRDLGFNGVPSRQSVLLQPTTECLVYLSEPPYTIVTLNEVEIAYLERVMFGLKNFDLVFIFKDHTQPPIHITAIPMSNLESVKDWLDSVDVLFAESTVNYNWTNIMKTVVEDPIGFYEMGGWGYLQPDADNENGSDEEELSSEYEPDESDEEEFEESDDEEDEEEDEEDEDEEEFEDSEEEESDEDGSSDDDDDSDDAPDWDEMEEKARREDSKRERSSDSGKRKSSSSSSKPAKRR